MSKTPRLHTIFLLFVFLFLYAINRSASLTSKDILLGVAPEDEQYYKGLLSSSSIKCKDGSKKFSKPQLNDDFCDCPDGSDEPGTSACPSGKFYCRNAGHVPSFLYSSRVNDGICDCCDGSDEYDGKVKCQDTCWEAGKVARDKLRKKIATYQEGVVIRKREIEQAKSATVKEEMELAKLKDEETILKGLVRRLKDRKEQIEKAEERERLQKEKEEKERKEAEESKLKESKTEEKTEDVEEPAKNDIDDKIGLLDGSTPLQVALENHHESPEAEHSDNLVTGGSPKDGVHQAEEDPLLKVDYKIDERTDHAPGNQPIETKEDLATNQKTDHEPGKQDKDLDEDTESLSREELGRLVASRWTGERTDQKTEEVNTPEDNGNRNQEEIPTETHEEEYRGYDSGDEDDRYDDDDIEDQTEDSGGEEHGDSSSSYEHESDGESDFVDITSTSHSSWLEKIQRTVRNILQAVNLFQTPVDKSDAERVRKEYDESSAKLSKIQSRISSLTQKLKWDFGREKEFYSFYGQCFEIKQNKYIYKICPFKQATQEEGYSSTRLGSWDKFEDSYRIMQFSNGDKCWNGPDRSLKVRLRCGLKNEVIEVDEPSRCEYLALLSTPALCLEEKLKELEDKLEKMTKEEPAKGHDEL